MPGEVTRAWTWASPPEPLTEDDADPLAREVLEQRDSSTQEELLERGDSLTREEVLDCRAQGGNSTREEPLELEITR